MGEEPHGELYIRLGHGGSRPPGRDRDLDRELCTHNCAISAHNFRSARRGRGGDGPIREGPATGGAPVGEGLDGELEGEEGVEGVLQPHVGRPLRARLLDRVGEQLRHEDLGAGTRRGRVTRRFRWGFLLFE